jgi:hypothetical protein
MCNLFLFVFCARNLAKRSLVRSEQKLCTLCSRAEIRAAFLNPRLGFILSRVQSTIVIQVHTRPRLPSTSKTHGGGRAMRLCFSNLLPFVSAIHKAVGHPRAEALGGSCAGMLVER